LEQNALMKSIGPKSIRIVARKGFAHKKSIRQNPVQKILLLAQKSREEVGTRRSIEAGWLWCWMHFLGLWSNRTAELPLTCSFTG
jgi:hypothetical protein